MTRKVRTTMQPDKEIEVGDAEYLDLKRQGLLIEESVPPPSAALTTSAKKPGTGAAGNKES
ncbi:hypothetical protein ABZX40_13595 [Streptomyces sp. NPDC004610]|uniref:hypothetical protein n=1 Tax=unclassified Streptomyces TaxID=2593676 RepID=UPI0033BBB452